MAELSPRLVEAFARHAGDIDHREDVIVTVEPGTSVADIDGIDVRSTARGGTIVMGSATEAGARDLAGRAGIVRIEPDGEMRALD